MTDQNDHPIPNKEQVDIVYRQMWYPKGVWLLSNQQGNVTQPQMNKFLLKDRRSIFFKNGIVIKNKERLWQYYRLLKAQETLQLDGILNRREGLYKGHFPVNRHNWNMDGISVKSIAKM